MIFDSAKMGLWIADILYRGSSLNGANFSYCKVVIYQGTQPSTSTFEANWSTDYWLNDTGSTSTSSTASNVLCAYGNIWSTSNYDNVYTLRSGNLISLGTQIPRSYYFRNGTPTWAMIIPLYDTVEGELTTTIAFSQQRCPKNFILAPVSGSLGSAPIQLSTATVSGSAPTLIALGLEISVGA